MTVTTRAPLPRLGMGVAALAGLFDAVPSSEAQATVTEARRLGVRMFDTAPLYGYGESERRLGRALEGVPRDDFIVATKVGRLLREEGELDRSQDPIWPGAHRSRPTIDFSRAAALQSLRESQDRLNLDRIDLVHVHDPEHNVDQAIEGAFNALDELRSEGVIRWVGVGSNDCNALLRFANEASPDCLMVSGRYTLLDQGAMDELLPVCLERGIAVVLASVFNSGILADPNEGAHFDYSPASQEQLSKALRIDAACRRWDVPLRAAALQFASAHRAVSTVLLGPRSRTELRDSLALLEYPIPGGLWDDLWEANLLPADCPVPPGASAAAGAGLVG